MPILLKFYVDLNDDNFFYSAAGAYLGMGIVGTGERKVGISIDRFNIEWGENEYGFKRLDYGFSLGVGFVFKRVLIGVDFDRSLHNINSDTTYFDDKTRNNVIRLSVGYRFAKLRRASED